MIRPRTTMTSICNEIKNTKYYWNETMDPSKNTRKINEFSAQTEHRKTTLIAFSSLYTFVYIELEFDRLPDNAEKL